MNISNVMFSITKFLAVVSGAYHGLNSNYQAATYFILLAIYASLEIEDETNG
jgi:hypothetical protein